MIHIVFEPANVYALKKSFELEASCEGDIVVIQDDYAVGPLQNIYTSEGITNRLEWWKLILQGGPYEGIANDGHVKDNEEVDIIKEKLNADAGETVWVWAAQNKHDVSGYYWLISQLKDYQGRIFILYLNNLPFINEKGGIFYPTNLYQIQPREFVKARKLARPITLSEFEIDPDEWLKLCREDKGVRLLEGGKKLVQRSYDYYDSELVKFIGKEWQKLSKIFQQYYSKVKETTGDAFLIWRLQQMITKGELEMQGNAMSMKEFEVRIKSSLAENATEEVTATAAG